MPRSLFLLPEEISPYSLSGRLGALAFFNGNDLSPTSPLKTLYCRLPERVLPQPRYCFLNALNPFLCKDAIPEFNFYTKAQELLLKSDLTVLWSMRPLKTFEPMQLRLCKEESFFKDEMRLLDLCTLLRALKLFEMPKLNLSANLLKTAELLGFKGELSRHQLSSRLEALVFLTQRAYDISPKLFAFMHRSLGDVKKSLTQALAAKKPQVLVNRSGALNLIMPLELKGLYLRYVKLQGQECVIETLDLKDGPLIAPAAVLTAERQHRLDFNLDKALENLALGCNAISDLFEEKFTSLEESFRAKLNCYDKKLYHTLSETHFDVAPIPQASAFFKNWLLLCRGDNFRATLIDTELERYRHLTAKALEQQIEAFSREVSSLVQLMDENSAEDAALADLIAKYPHFLN